MNAESSVAKALSKVRLQLETLELRLVPSSLTGLSQLQQVSGTSPFAGSTADAGQPGTVYINSEVEPSLAVDPTNSKHMVAAWQQDRWSNTGCRGIVTAVTFNGGNSWSTPAAVPGLTLVSGGTYQRSSDPWLSFATNGDLYLSSNPFDITDGNEIMEVSKSTDGGRTWGPPTALITDTSLGVIDDKESVTADPTNSNFVYAAWERLTFPNGVGSNRSPLVSQGGGGPTWFARSTNAGQSWEPARIIYDPGNEAQTIGNQVLVLPNGTLVDIFDVIYYHRQNGGVYTYNVAAIRSTDPGQTWSAPTIVSPLYDLPTTDPNTGAPVRTGDTLPEAAVDRNSGAIYLVWQDGRFSGGTHADVALSMSADGGLTWSTPIKVNQTPTNIAAANQQAFDPSVAVGANGTVAVSYYDFRNNGSGPGALTDDWIAFATANPTNAASWGNELRLTNKSFNIELAPTSNSSGTGYFVGDYQWLATGGKTGNNFEALFCMPAGSDPANAYFRDPSPAGSAAPAVTQKPAVGGESQPSASATLPPAWVAAVQNSADREADQQSALTTAFNFSPLLMATDGWVDAIFE